MSTATAHMTIDWTAVADGTPFPPAAFAFVQEGLGYTSDLVVQDGYGLHELDRHIDGQQLCLGLRDFAIEQYGLLAPVVLRQWGVDRTDDFGTMVFHMVELGLLRTNASDSLDDFRAVFDFGVVFHDHELAERIGAGR